MEWKWCWRCGRETGFLDDHEVGLIAELMNEIPATVPTVPTLTQLRDSLIPAAEKYAELTGQQPLDLLNSMLHVLYRHRLSLLGPDCPSCGRSLRTPLARICFNCDWRYPVD